AQLLSDYVHRMQSSGYAMVSKWPYRYAAFDNNVAVTSVHRHLYAALDAPQRRAFGDPFETGRSPSFFEWAHRPTVAGDTLSPFLEQVLVESPDARSAFPDASGKQSKAFVTWAQTSGSDRFGYDPRLADPTPTAWNELRVGPAMANGE